MFQGDRLSTVPLPSEFKAPRDQLRMPLGNQSLLTSYHIGGVGIGDASQGLQVKTWTAQYNGTSIMVSAPSVAETAVVTEPDIVQLDLAFDQNMRPFLAYELLGGAAKYYWYDTSINSFVTTTLPVGSHSAFCTTDDTRPLQRGVSDIILTYLRGSTLYFRKQRDRYLIEHTLRTGLPNGSILQFGMNGDKRLQWRFEPED